MFTMEPLMRFRLLTIATVALALGSPSRAASDWVPLGDGKTLDDWVVRGGTAKYRI
jgi:hypothetical protein